jgi:hypothetical protein
MNECKWEVNRLVSKYSLTEFFIFRFVGPNSEVQTLNGICILSQNIINEKVFLVLWFWYVTKIFVSMSKFHFLMPFFYLRYIIMFVISGCSIVLRICTLAIPALRHFLLSEKIGGNRRNAKVITQRYFTTWIIQLDVL